MAAWIQTAVRAATLAVWVCLAHACAGPGLEPPGSDNAGAGAGALQDAGEPPMGGNAGAGGGSGSGGSGGFSPPAGGSGGGDGDGDGDSDAGEASMDASVDDEDGGADD